MPDLDRWRTLLAVLVRPEAAGVLRTNACDERPDARPAPPAGSPAPGIGGAPTIPRIDDAWRELTARYREPGRAYHHLGHLADCLREFDHLRQLADRPADVEAAIWFHDAVYDPRAPDNEARSAELAVASLTALGVAATAARRVADLILLTRHDVMPASRDGQILVDVDLAILGQPPEVFDRYEAAVRTEYGWVAEREFWRRRAALLAALLARPRLFHTDPAHARLEATARANLARSLHRAATNTAG